MRILRHALAGVLTGVVMIAALTAFSIYMRHQAEQWASVGVYLTVVDRIGMSISFFWFAFWPLLVPFILGFWILGGLFFGFLRKP